MQANVRGQLGPEVQVIGCPRKRYAASGCERLHVWPIADEEAQLARLAEEVLPKITAPTAALQSRSRTGVSRQLATRGKIEPCQLSQTRLN
jgi:hypothetical protein